MTLFVITIAIVGWLGVLVATWALCRMAALSQEGTDE